MENLSLNKPSLQSSTSQWSTSEVAAEDARNANNGDFRSVKIFHTSHQADPWWQVDLQGEFVIEHLNIFNWRPTADRLRRFSVLLSLDGKKWTVTCRKSDDTLFGVKNDLPYRCQIDDPQLARFVRIRRDGHGYLNFKQCEVFGYEPNDDLRARLSKRQLDRQLQRTQIPDGSGGFIAEFDDLAVLVDPKYAAPLGRALKAGTYEAREREVAKAGLITGDRVLEAGTAIGVVTMAAAAIVGAENIVSFEANPYILEHARANFRRNSMDAIKSRHAILKNRSSIDSTHAEFFVSRDFVSSRTIKGDLHGDIMQSIQVPIVCLEDEIAAHRANVLLFDIEGAEIDLLSGANLTDIRAIIMETHYRFAGVEETDRLISNLYRQGFTLDLAVSGQQVLLMRR